MTGRLLSRVFLAGMAACCLAACHDDDDDDKILPTPTPRPGVTPTPFPQPGVTPTPTPDDSDFSDTGAAMTASTEQVTILNAVVDGDLLTILVQRANGEIWQFSLDGAPAVQIGDKVFYENSALVFGDPEGDFTFPGSDAVAVVESAVRVQ